MTNFTFVAQRKREGIPGVSVTALWDTNAPELVVD